jgi:hypothetical protein
MTKTIHQAGPLEGLVQRCSRCGTVLNDYTHAMVPETDARKPLGGWAEGVHVEVQFHEYYGSSTLTMDPPTCEPRG